MPPVTYQAPCANACLAANSHPDRLQLSKPQPCTLPGGNVKVAPSRCLSLVQEAVVAVTSVQEARVVPGSAQEAEMAVSRQEAGLPLGLLPLFLGTPSLKPPSWWKTT